MGALYFEVTRRERIPEFAPEVAHVFGVDRCPWEGTTEWDEAGRLVHRRNVSESGVFVCPWILDSGEWICVATTSLREQERPYQLERELARGTLSRLRELLSQMESAGVPIRSCSRSEARASQQAFLDHLCHRDVDLACQSINHGLSAIDALMEDLRRFERQRAAEAVGIPHTLRVGTVGTPFTSPSMEELFLEMFDAVAIPVRWRDVESEEGQMHWDELDRWIDWAQSQQRRILLGPLLRIDRHWLPDWVYLLQNRSLDVLLRSIDEFIGRVVERYRGRADLWQVAAGLNVPGDLGLVSDDRLRVAAAAIESVRSRAQGTPVVMRFDQPWSETLIRSELELPAFYFADALVRAELGLRGIGIDIHWGYWPGGSLHRDALAVHMMLQRWSRLELPLLVGLTVPHSVPDNPQDQQVLSPKAGQSISDDSQAKHVGMLASVAAASPAVHGVAYNAFCDADSARFACAGLVTTHGSPRPACHAWTKATRGESG